MLLTTYPFQLRADARYASHHTHSTHAKKRWIGIELRQMMKIGQSISSWLQWGIALVTMRAQQDLQELVLR